MKRRPWAKGEKLLVVITGLGALIVPLGFYLWSLLKVENGFALRASDAPLATLVWSPDSSMLAVSGGQLGAMASRSIWVWRVANGALKHNLAGPTVPVKRLEFSPDSHYLASYSDYEIFLWSTDLGIREQTLPVCAQSARWGIGGTILVIDGSFAPSPTPRRFKTNTPNQWHINQMHNVRSAYVPPPNFFQPKPEKKQLSPDGQFFFVDVPPPLPQKRGNFSSLFPASAYAANRSIAFSSQPAQPFSSPNDFVDDAAGTVEIRRTQSGRLLKTELRHKFKSLWWKNSRHLRGIVVTSTGLRFQEARLWDFDCQTLRESWQHLNVSAYDDVHISPDKRWLAWDEITKMRLFDFKRNAFVAVWETDPDQRTKSAFSPDSRDIAWLDGSAVRV